MGCTIFISHIYVYTYIHMHTYTVAFGFVNANIDQSDYIRLLEVWDDAMYVCTYTYYITLRRWYNGDVLPTVRMVKIDGDKFGIVTEF